MVIRKNDENDSDCGYKLSFMELKIMMALNGYDSIAVNSYFLW